MPNPSAPDVDEVQKLADEGYRRTPPQSPFGVLYQNPPILMSTQTFMWFDDLAQVSEFLKTNALFELDQSGEWGDREQIESIHNAAIRIAREGLTTTTLGPLDCPCSSMELIWCGLFDDLCSGKDSVSKAIIGDYAGYCFMRLYDELGEDAKALFKRFSSITADNLNGFSEFISEWNERNA